MKPLVSVIVPVYKVEDCLIRCLNSLCKQTLRDIEIILVDDASPDCCGAICDEYATKDNRFKVVHHVANKGLSSARNTGIKEATAAYLMFVDSDDYVHADFCRLPYECAVQQEADLVLFNRSEVGQPKLLGRAFYKTVSSSMESGYRTQVEALDLLHNEVQPFAWNKLYARHLFVDVSFPKGYMYEDIATTYKTVLKASTIYYLNKELYYHCFRIGSIGTNRSKKALMDLYSLYMQQYRDLVAWGKYPPEKLDWLLKHIAFIYCVRKRKTNSDPEYEFCAALLRSDKTFFKSEPWQRKVLLLLLKYCPCLFEQVCTKWGKKHEG